MTIKEELKQTYSNLASAFGIYSRTWSDLHERYSPCVFCKENRLAIIGEYLVWKDFVERALEYDVVYYAGIDAFLEEYKTAVLNRVNFD